MKYLLDTDHISFLQRKSGSEYTTLIARMGQYSSRDFAFSIVSFHEQVIGAHTFINRSSNTTNLLRGYTLLQEIIKVFSVAPVLGFDPKAAKIFEELKAQRVSVATMDLRIAAIALSHNLILLTRNTKDFSKVSNLIIEDWSS
jgi:tRNA(fMet)-specific endonuclease VapC